MATRFFWHNALFDTGIYPGSYPINVFGGTAPTVQAHLTPLNYNVMDATSVHRSMDITKGTSQVTKSFTSLGSVASQTYYLSKFISPPLLGVTSISANTWQLVYAFAESHLSANFIGPIIYFYVWRPSTGARIGGWINDQVNPANITEPATINSERLKKTTFPGLAVSGVADGDVLIWELAARITQAAASPYTDTFYIDGTNEYAAGVTGDVVTDMAAYIETPQNLTFQPSVITASTDNKDILKQRTVIEV
jgi:hypothetical protein